MSSLPQKPSPVLSIRFGSLLPWAFHFMAVIGLLLGFMNAIQHPWMAIILAVVGLFVLTASEGTEIDLQNKKFREYTSVYFMKTGEWVSFDSIEKIYINKNKVRQKVTPSRTGFTTTFTFSQFSAYLKFNEEETVELVKHKDRMAVMKRAQTWAAQLNIPLYDNTGED